MAKPELQKRLVTWRNDDDAGLDDAIDLMAETEIVLPKLVAVLAKLCTGGIVGSAFTDPDVKAALRTLAHFQECDWADVQLNGVTVGVKTYPEDGGAS